MSRRAFFVISSYPQGAIPTCQQVNSLLDVLRRRPARTPQFRPSLTSGPDDLTSPNDDLSKFLSRPVVVIRAVKCAKQSRIR